MVAVQPVHLDTFPFDNLQLLEMGSSREVALSKFILWCEREDQDEDIFSDLFGYEDYNLGNISHRSINYWVLRICDGIFISL